MSFRRSALLVLLLAVLVALAVAAGAWFGYLRFAAAPIAGPAPGAGVVVRRGDGFRAVIGRLREAGVHQGRDYEWLLLGRMTGAAGHIKAGEYALAPGLSPRTLLQNMRDGRTIQHRFTLVDGWNIRQLRAALAQAEPLRHASAGMDDAALMQAIGHAGQHPEGRFLPETYLYQRGDSDLDVLRRAHAAMDKALAEAWDARAPSLPLKTPDEALALASIVEKETGAADERAKIAGVFVRRLQKGMLLQTDPTVIYGMGEAYDGNIRKRDLLADTPYNTYTRAGLPPTPIAMPGRSALQAATHPAPGDALYFVAIGDGSGRHVFSSSLDAHNAAVAAYLRNRRAAGPAP